MHRRNFLGALAASPLAAADPVRLAVIGVGGRGNALMKVAANTPGARVTAVCDVDQARLEKAQQNAAQLGFGQVKGLADMRRVFDGKDIDAVLIATPDHWHAPAAILACDAGKDVYVEKPVSHNYREGRLLVEAARRNARVVQAGLQSRSRPSTIKAIEIARSGKLGRVLMAKAWNTQLRKNIGKHADGPVPLGVDYENWVGPAQMIPFNTGRFHYEWHWHWNFGTGDLGNDGAHQIDIARWALGAGLPTRVSGMGAKLFFDDDQQTPDTMNLTFEYGAKALVWEMRIWTPYLMDEIDNGVAIYGTDAMMHIGDPGGRWGYRIFDRKGKLVENYQDDAPETHMANFIDSVRTRRRPNCDIEEGHITTGHCHLGNIVARTGRNVSFDPAAERISGDDEANSLLRRQYRRHWGAPRG